MRKAKRKTENKSKKYVLLATYVFAVVCLLAGLFLPLFNGKDILALQFMDVLKSLMKKESEFTLPYPVALFGIEKASFDFMAAVIVLYTVVTALAVLSFVPVALSVIANGKLARKIYYAVEVLAAIALTLYLVPVYYMCQVRLDFPFGILIPFSNLQSVGLNMVIAALGTGIALIALCALDKGKAAAVKVGLFILSLIGVLALFDMVTLLSKQEAFADLTDKVATGFFAEGSGVNYLTILFTSNILDVLKSAPEVKDKALIMLASLTAAAVLVNFFIDTVKLATRKDKTVGRIFDMARFGLVTALAIATLVTALICKQTLGLMLIVIVVVALVALTIAVLRFVFGKSKKAKKSSERRKAVPAEATYDEATPAAESAEGTPAPAYAETEEYGDISFDNVDLDGVDLTPSDEVSEQTQASEEQTDDGYSAQEPAEQTPVTPIYDDEGYMDPKLDEQFYQNSLVKPKPIEIEEPPVNSENIEDSVLYPPDDGTYLVPDDEVDSDAEVVEEAHPVEEAPQPVVEAVEEEYTSVAAAEEQPVPIEEPIVFEESFEDEDLDEPYEEEPQPVEEPYEEEIEEAKPANPFREEVKPYNPYERHNNPFRNFDDPPTNPYRQPEPVKPVETPAEKPPVKPLQPRSIIQEFKPVPPVNEQPQKEPQVYTIDTIYAGPTDDFIRKLSNDERIEFAKTFIEKVKGNIGAIPDYVVGGNNKKFFSGVFIYLGRIRGMVSDGLLNKMYKELNLL